jgi:hypothetical protein
MAITNADIQAWTAANPTASHQDVYSAMQQHGVTPEQLAQATGWDTNAINSKYAELSKPATPAPTQAPWVAPYEGYRPTMSDVVARTGLDPTSASNLLYGAVGANTDYRDLNAILNSSDPTSALRAANYQMYFGENAPSRAQQAIAAGYQPMANTANIVAQHGNIAVRKDPKSGALSGQLIDKEGFAVGNSFSFGSPEQMLGVMSQYGVPLSTLQGMNDTLAKAGVNVSPYNLYAGTGSNHGIDFDALAKGQLGTAYDWTSDANVSTKGPTALNSLQEAQRTAGYYGLQGANNNLLNYNDVGFMNQALGNGVGGVVPYDVNQALTQVGTGTNKFGQYQNLTQNYLQQPTQQQTVNTAPQQTNPYTNLTQQPSVQQQSPSGYVNSAFPQYTPNYGSLTQQPATQPQYTPNYANNALMRPVTQNSNITAQNQYQNIGYNNKRSSLWGDW